MTRRTFCGILVFFVALIFLAKPSPSSGEDLHSVWAVKDAKIMTLTGPPIEKGTLVIRNGLIEACGVNISIPQDAEVIDGSKLIIYPGFTDSLGQSLLKLPEEKFDMEKLYSGDFNDKDRGVTPSLKAFDYINLGKAAFEKYYKYGFTAAQVIPDRGVITGQSSIFCFSDPDKNKALFLKDVCLGIGFVPSNFMMYPNSLMGVHAYLKQAFTDVSYFDSAEARWLKEMKGLGRPEYNANFETMAAYATGKKPVIFFCRNQYDIRRALTLATDFNLSFFICDLGGESFEAIPELKNSKARVLCTVAFKAPGTSIYAQRGKEEREKAEKEIYPKNPAKLAEAGIPFAFSSLGTDDPKSFMEGIQKAIDAGLAKEKALEALTKNPAVFFGGDKALGTIERGKVANVILTEGEMFTKEVKVRYAFADGKKFELKEVVTKEGEKPTVNVSGKWELFVEGQMGMRLTIEFAQEDASLSGKLVTPFGAFDFTGGIVSGSDVSFEVTLSLGGQEIDLFFSATVEGETMRGTVVQGTAGSAEFTAKRIPG